MVKYRFAEVDVGGKKFYAVIFSSGERHIYDNWAECEKKVKGRSKVKYKGFLSRQDAELFLGGRPIQKNNDDIAVYVDGAFLSHYSSYAGYGWVAVQNDREIARGYGCTEYPAKSRNVD
ncbi:MAG TPA: RNase H1/viroplasmin domain-containing protein, partial [Spirochaetota bacterium]|nr:RNase H1/viroplasmin domain-containing protein [Spirochaetota bacterium]